MTEQRIPAPDDLRTLLMKMGPDAYALAWVAPGTDLFDRAETEPPSWARAGSTVPGSITGALPSRRSPGERRRRCTAGCNSTTDKGSWRSSAMI